MSDDAFEWGATKAAANYRKHGVDSETAMEVFDDPFAIEEPDVRQRDEERIRIISARPATRREHDDYYSQKTQD